MLRLAPALLLLLSCRPSVGPERPEGPSPGDSLPSDSQPPGDSGVESIPDNPVEDHGCASLYDQAHLPTFALEVSAQAWAALEADYAAGVKDYHPTAFGYTSATGEVLRVEEAAVRLRGNPGFSWLGEKMQFVISFNEYDPDGRFQGLRKISLDASWYDPTVLRDRLAYAYLRHLGLPASCANSARLEINGVYYGLYKSVEYVDHEFLERNFGDELAGGTLWKYGTTATANEDEADPAAVTAYWADASVRNQEELSDLEHNLLAWAAEVVLPHNDGYWCCAHNFYLYEHPERGLMFVPWDLDYSFDATPYTADPYTWSRGGNADHFERVVAHPDWGLAFLEAMERAVAAFDPDMLEGWLGEWAEQTATAFSEEPHTNFTQVEHDQALERLAAYLHARHGWAEAWTRCQQGEDVDADGDGYPACQDCDDTDPTVHPGAAEACNLRDDDCDGFTDNAPDCDTCHEHAFDSRMLTCWYPRSWAEAQADCEAHGATLGFPRSTEDWYALFIHTYWHEHYHNGTYLWWGGATDVAQEGRWLSPEGEPVGSWAGWAGGEPNGGQAENCAALYPNGFTWHDADCSAELPYLCRYAD